MKTDTKPPKRGQRGSGSTTLTTTTPATTRTTAIDPIQFLAILIAVICAVTTVAEAQVPERQHSYGHSLHVPFLHSSFDNEYWDYGGSTVIKLYDYVRLTTDQTNQAGYIWGKFPIHASGWSVEFDFKIHGKGTHVYGDGFAFWFTDSKYKEGPVFGAADNFRGLGIFFDTFPNDRQEFSFPYISAMLGDGQTSYDHQHDNRATVAGRGCEANIRGNSDILKARVSYFKNKMLELEFTDSSGTWHKCFVLSDVNLPDNGYFGFSAATGSVSDNHDILKVDTYTDVTATYMGNDATSSKIHEAVGEDHTMLNAGRWLYHTSMWLFKIGAVGLLLAGAYFVYRRYFSKNQLNSNFSFDQINQKRF